MVRSPALVVPRHEAEAARRTLAERGIERQDLKIQRSGDRVVIPVLRADGAPPSQGAWAEAEFEPRVTVRSYKDVVDVPDGLRNVLPSSFDLIGDLAVIKIPKELEGHGAAIGKALRTAHPNLRAVFADEGVQGPFRTRRVTLLAGGGGPRTVHREFGNDLEVDVASAYFSPRLATEHDRVASLVRRDERVLDATAGVGPYSVMIARRQPDARVVAVDLNSAAVALLRANLRRNRVESSVETHEGDGFRLAVARAPWDRIIVNLPHGPPEDLGVAVSALRLGGTLHATRVLEADAAAAWCRSFAESSSGELVHSRLVHAYSPTSGMYAFDVVRRG